MPAKWFICPDKQQILIEDCLNACRMDERCSTLPYLRMIAYDRKFKGVSPSMAGTGARQIFLKAVCDYAVDPQDRAFAALGTAVHGKLALSAYIHNVLSEEKLSDEQMQGIADVLEQDEQNPGYYVLTDYKTWGSYVVAKSLGIYTADEPILKEDGSPVLLKSGKNKGKIKTRKVVKQDPNRADTYPTNLQLNRYRIFFEKAGFPISRIQIQAIVRDGNTYIAKSRGVDRNIYIIPIELIGNHYTVAVYDLLQKKVDMAFKNGWIERCEDHENWNGMRCQKYCEVAEHCGEMDKKGGIKWKCHQK